MEIKKNVDELKLEYVFNDICDIALREELLDQPMEVFIMVTDNSEIQSLNNEFRNVDAPTDVLSFPLNDLDKPLKEKLQDGFIPEINPESGRISLGDIVISADRAIEQANEYGHSVKREFAFLCAHGMLHLLGYDHIDESEEIVMREKQRSILEKANILRDCL